MTENKLNAQWITLSIEAAITASQKVMEIYETDFDIVFKADHSPVTAADKASSKIIYNILNKTQIPIVSEEESIPTYETRKTYDRIWLIDPIDGTKEFIKKNGEFCICIALIHNQNPVFGLIASPTKKEITLGGKGFGAFHFNFDDPNPLSEKNKLSNIQANATKTIAYSRSHLSKRAEQFVDMVRNIYDEPQIIRKGSALKFVDLVKGHADFYPRLAPTMEWDIAAGQAIYEAVGGEVLDFANFEPLKYNKEDLYNPHFIAKNKMLEIKK